MQYGNAYLASAFYNNGSVVRLIIKLKSLLSIFFMIAVIAVLVSGCTGAMDNKNNVSQGSSVKSGAALVWQNTYGGPDRDSGSMVIGTSDGGYAILGSTTILTSVLSYNKTYLFNTTRTFLVKTDGSGKELWNKTYGNGTAYSSGSSVVQTGDGGYAILGSSSQKAVLVKTDASGNEAWNKTFGQSMYDTLSSLVQTSDGGYAITGGTGNTIMEFKVLLDKVDADGKLAWNKTYGPGSGRSVVQAKDGSYAIAGNALSGLKSKPFLIKTDASGNQVWNKTYAPGPGAVSQTDVAIDTLSSAVQTSDGGYALAGTTGTISYDLAKDPLNNSSLKNMSFTVVSQIFLIKTDANGNQEWCKTYGRAGNYEGSSVVQTDDGGYAILGDGNNITTIDMSSMNLSSLVQYKLYLVKTDANGNQVWDSTYGGVGTNKGLSLVKSGDRGYVLAGSTNSYGKGDHDVYLVKVA